MNHPPDHQLPVLFVEVLDSRLPLGLEGVVGQPGDLVLARRGQLGV